MELLSYPLPPPLYVYLFQIYGRVDMLGMFNAEILRTVLVCFKIKMITRDLF